MATIISTLFTALDGVVEIDPAWHSPYFDEQMGAAVDEDYAGADALVLGRVTYESFAGAWPDREEAGEDDAAFAAQLGDTRKLVVTHRGDDLGWRNVEALQGDLVAAIGALSAEPGVEKIVIPGSISVVRQLLAAGLVDELRLLVHPVAARRGRRLFDEGEPPYHLRLVRAETFPTGVVRMIYRAGESSANGSAETPSVT